MSSLATPPSSATPSSSSGASDSSLRTATDDDNDSIALFDISRASRDPLPIRSDDRYEILGEHARGGLGRILLARDREVGRIVAIKELLRNRRRGEARFVREAIVTAHLDHPSIVPVYEVGRWPSGEPFYSMKLVSGRPLKELIGDAATIDERLALIPNILAIADAAAYAHSRGIIHRDLKPPNIIVGDFGETIVIDWGLAKNIGEDDSTLDSNDSADGDDAWNQSPPETHPNLTRQGAVLGTASYMAPEQARGDDVDERADVYAIGAILYHTLSGSAPFSGTTSQETINQVIAGPPRSLSKIAPSVPRDLAAIAQKAMERKRNDRYDDAQELAEDLRRYQEGQLVAAREYSRSQLFVRWLRRNRFALALIATLAIAGTVATLGIRSQRDGAIAAKEEAVAANGVVRLERETAVSRTNQLILAQAAAKLDYDPMTSLALLKHYPENGEDWERAAEIASAAIAKGVITRTIGELTDGAIRFSFDNAAEHLLTRSIHGEIHVINIETKRIRRIGTAQVGTGDAILTGDGQWAFWHDDSGAFVKQVDGGPTHQLAKDEVVTHAVRSADGKKIVFSTASGDLIEWLSTTNTTHQLFAQDTPIHLLAYSREATWVATADTSKVIRQHYRTETRPPIKTSHLVLGLDYSIDGTELLVADTTNTLRRYNAQTAKLIEVLHRGKRTIPSTDLGSLTWNRSQVISAPDGTLVAELGDRVLAWRPDNEASWLNVPNLQTAVTQFDLSGDSQAFTMTEEFGVSYFTSSGSHVVSAGKRNPLFVTKFVPGSNRLLVGAMTGPIYEWAPPKPATSKRSGPTSKTLEVVSRLDGSLFAGSFNGEVWHWDKNGSGKLLGRTEGYVNSLSLIPGRNELVAGWGTGEVRRYDLGEGTETGLAKLDGAILDLVILVDGTILVLLADGTAALISPETDDESANARRVRVQPTSARVVGVAVDNSGKRGVLLLKDGALINLEPDGGKRLLLAGDPTQPASTYLATSKKGELIAISRSDGLLKLVDAQHGTIRSQRQLPPVFSLEFSPNGRWLSMVSISGGSFLLDVKTMNVRDELQFERASLSTAISPNGQLSAVAQFGGGVVVRSLATNRTVVLHSSTDFENHRIHFSADSKSVISTGGRGGLRVWQFDETQMPPESPREIKEWLHKQTDVEMTTEELGIVPRKSAIAN